jgi:hypothetical protein
MSKPGESHLRASKEILRYLSRTRTYGITYNCATSNLLANLLAYSDASWGIAYNGKLYTGWLVKYYDGVISWISNVQKSIAQSLMESKLIAANKVSKELAWLETLWLEVIGLQQTLILFIDNQPAIDIIYNTKHHFKAKHINIRYFYIRNDIVKPGRLEVRHIPGENQIADILTKQLLYNKFQRLRNNIGIS